MTIQFQPRSATYQLLPVRDAIPVTFEGFDGLEFCYYKMDGLWAIAEISSGLPVTRGHGSKPEARDKAAYLLSIQGLEKTKRAIAYHVERMAAK
jgi:hypothetical protein